MSTSDSSDAAANAAIDPVALANECEEAVPHTKVGQFYGPVGSLSYGAGIVMTNVVYPVFLPEPMAYGTRRGTALILTHECDIDPDNIRQFNDNAMIAPIIGLKAYVDSVAEIADPAETRSFLLNVAAGKTTRMAFLPRYGDKGNPLYYGGLIDLNYLASCGIAALTAGEKLCALSGTAVATIDIALQNHLIRPKAENLPLPR